MSFQSKHKSVLSEEVLHYLDIKKGDIVLDGTINGGGHASLIVEHLGPQGIFIGIDQDSKALAFSKERLKGALPKIHLIHKNTRHLDSILDDLEIHSIDKILLDLGWSSNQFEDGERGFSFLVEGPLKMTMSDNTEDVLFTAHDVVNFWDESSLVDILKFYGEESFASRIAKAILERRQEREITTTIELAELIKEAIPKKFHKKGIHPATKSFQAIRIAVNDEMEALREILYKAFERMSSGGRLVIISFHSIEDRIIKNFFKDRSNEKKAILITKKPITASSEELLENKRSRSAKLRVLEKL
ncbi:MAG: 16S rRNA (cytosine(1402)-N(4))-methyltransferase RsmH [Candidatus Pacebacteria bacterium]|nr:16S rRNA (cytosine(1402)-N(4))-methyltransferase RsmH [Candidatus Paceibacterota bacterium]